MGTNGGYFRSHVKQNCSLCFRAEGEPHQDGLWLEARFHQLPEERLANAERLCPSAHGNSPASGWAGHRSQSDWRAGEAGAGGWALPQAPLPGGHRAILIGVILFPQNIKLQKPPSHKRRRSPKWRWECWTEEIASTTSCRRSPSRVLTSTCLPSRVTSATGTDAYF